VVRVEKVEPVLLAYIEEDEETLACQLLHLLALRKAFLAFALFHFELRWVELIQVD